MPWPNSIDTPGSTFLPDIDPMLSSTVTLAWRAIDGALTGCFAVAICHCDQPALSSRQH